MKAMLVLFLIILPQAHGAFIVSPGVSVTAASKTEEKSLSGKELVNFDAAMGITVETEWTFLNESVGLMVGGNWKGSPAESQYSYTNPDNPLDTAKVPDLKTNFSSINAFLGPRFRFLNLKYFKLFAGGGWMPGIMYLTYNENKFELANGSLIGFKEKEQKNFNGNYFEAGAELYSTKAGAVRLIGRHLRQRSDRFETLGDKRLNITTSMLTIQYIHLF